MVKELELMLKLENSEKLFKLILKIIIFFFYKNYKTHLKYYNKFKFFKFNKIINFFLFDFNYFNKNYKIKKTFNLDIASKKKNIISVFNKNIFYLPFYLNLYFYKKRNTKNFVFLFKKYMISHMFKKKYFNFKNSKYLNKYNYIRIFNYKKYNNYKLYYNKLLIILFNNLKYNINFFINNRIKKEIFINFLKRKNFLNLFYKNFYYIGFVKKKKSNIYITITNRHGDVIISQSFGKIGLYAKKKRKIQDPIKALCIPVIKKLNEMGVFVIECIYFNTFNQKILTDFKKVFIKTIYVRKYKNYLSLPHNNRTAFKYKKIRRI
jgi:ribosomal protein S11